MRKFHAWSSYTRHVVLLTRGTMAALAALSCAASLAAQAPPPPTQAPPPPVQAPPKPTPTPTPQAGPTGQPAAVDPQLAGVPIYPGVDFLESFDIGDGQSLFVFGTNDMYESVVAFYKNEVGRATEVSKREPAIQQFDLGSTSGGSITKQRPSVLVKDFTWPDPAGYLHVSGAAATRYKTLIQIIPPTK
jgi:hypothetical protein